MNADEFVETVRTENGTELSRLGSSKSLYAATGGEMSADAVLEAAANAEYDAHETFSAWAADEDHDAAREAFAATATEEKAHYEQVRERLSAFDPALEPSAMQEVLRDAEDTVPRAGALLGRTLATERSKSQLTGFFVGQADPQTAGVFRKLKADVEDQLARATDLLDDVCESDDDWERAAAAATEAIEAAYGEYAESLEDMGVNPKPVC